ncbi:MAG: hypothetical protein HYU77_12165 [Betaproteobacteria bacterium]|nr:hypothetical protein [Betaproteobacteria bacterium]
MTHSQQNEEISMLRSEIEMLMAERKNLLKIAGAAAVFVAALDSKVLPESSYDAAEALSKCLNDMSEDSLREALEAIRADGDAENLG